MSLPILVVQTIGNVLWMQENCEKLKQVFPTEWTVLSEDNVLDIILCLHSLDIPIQNDEELFTFLAQLEHLGFLLRQDLELKVNTTWTLVSVTHFNVHGDTRYVQ